MYTKCSFIFSIELVLYSVLKVTYLYMCELCQLLHIYIAKPEYSLLEPRSDNVQQDFCERKFYTNILSLFVCVLSLHS